MDKSSVIQPRQAEFNLAILNGEEISLPTDDLYIPPNALKIFLESFEGPLDLLLYFIKKTKLEYFRNRCFQDYRSVCSIHRVNGKNTI